MKCNPSKIGIYGNSPQIVIQCRPVESNGNRQSLSDHQDERIEYIAC